MFGIEAHQGRCTKTTDGQQQQRAIAESGRVAATGGGQAHQLGRR